MPKMKSVKGAVKRFKVKKSGKIKRGTAYRSHILTKVDGQHHRQMNSPKYVDGVDAKTLKKWSANSTLLNEIILKSN